MTDKKCNFSNLKFGDRVFLSGGTCTCPNCGGSTQAQLESIEWEYNGHSNDMDLFSATKLIYCPTCGDRIDGYAQRCGEFGGLDVTSEFQILKAEA
jgi:predicted RNA-binding Zn-ribbon protein involved in translation (DUF1610 family)